jgi:hypothetical protein
MSLGNIQKAITTLKPADQAKLLAYLQKTVKVSPTAPVATTPPAAKPVATKPVAKPKYTKPATTSAATV